MTTLVTGAAGFIGYHVAQSLLDKGEQVVGLDNLCDYYDVTLKEARLDRLRSQSGFSFHKIELADRSAMEALFKEQPFRRVVHLAAQAGVRYSIDNPHAYVESNLVGFLHILEGCRAQKVEHLVYASTSSVYGANTTMPFTEDQTVGHPLSLYAATKRANELMAHSYANLYQLPCSALRFFTVYGPWGRPDMALFKFVKNILADEPIDVFNHGKHRRDFTYVDDIVEGIVRVLDHPAQADSQWEAARPNPATSFAPFAVFNIGNQQSIELMRYIEAIEKSLGKKATCNMLPLQAGDVEATEASADRLQSLTGYKPATTVDEGVDKFIQWYRGYYGA